MYNTKCNMFNDKYIYLYMYFFLNTIINISNNIYSYTTVELFLRESS